MAHEAADSVASSGPREEGSGDSGDEPPQPGAATSPIDLHADPGLDLPSGLLTFVADRLVRAVDELAVPVERLTVRLVGDAAMSELHRRHSGIDGTTDVLTFSGAAPDEPVDADIACCVDEAGRQAARRDHPLAEEVLLYALHGLLHCLGHDDHDPEAYARMHAEEDRVLTAIGVGPRFAAEERRATDDGSAASDSPPASGVRS